MALHEYASKEQVQEIAKAMANIKDWEKTQEGEGVIYEGTNGTWQFIIGKDMENGRLKYAAVAGCLKENTIVPFSDSLAEELFLRVVRIMEKN